MNTKLMDFVSIKLDKNAKNPLYVQLYEQIKLMIKQHLLSPGYKLPTVRNLAQNLPNASVKPLNLFMGI